MATTDLQLGDVLAALRDEGSTCATLTPTGESERPPWAVVFLTGTPTQNQNALRALDEAFGEPSVRLSESFKED